MSPNELQACRAIILGQRRGFKDLKGTARGAVLVSLTLLLRPGLS